MNKNQKSLNGDNNVEQVTGNHHKGNSLNNLTGKEWLKFTKTWFVYDGPLRNADEMLHPAKYPEGMIEEFIKFFTKEGELIFDPFLGTASSLVAANRTGRNGIGIEITEKYAEIAQRRVNQKSLTFNVKQEVIVGDSFKCKEIWKKKNLPKVDFIICSPPYWNMLKKQRGGVVSAQKVRKLKKLDTHYSDLDNDLGNIDDYDAFVEKLGQLYEKTIDLLKNGKYLVIIIQNLRDEGGNIRTLAWDTTKRVEKIKGIRFQGERIWCQNNKKLGIWGYPKIFIPNYHHHYCLIFKKENGDNL
jgi:DNA modification methylase